MVAGVLVHQDRGWWVGVGFVPSLGWNRSLELAARLTGFMLVELAARLTGLMLVRSLVMSEACLWACHSGMRLVHVDMSGMRLVHVDMPGHRGALAIAAATVSVAVLSCLMYLR